MQLAHDASQTGSNLAGTDYYDQIAFHPVITANKFTGASGVFDCDKTRFSTVWQHQRAHFQKFTSLQVSNHRLIWSEWHNQRP